MLKSNSPVIELPPEQIARPDRADSGIARWLKPLASLKFTVVLLALAMVLIFAGTTVQSEMGIWDVQRRFFHSWFCFLEWRLLFPLWTWGRTNIPGAIPFPGGYTLIVLLLVNLLAAHSVRFKLSWKRSGILLIHSGLILLLVGEIVTSQFAVESQMVLDVGGSANFAQDIRTAELAITDRSPADHDDVTVIPAGRLMQRGTIQHPSIPFAVRIDEYYPNSTVLGPMQAGARKDARATAGNGVGLTILPRPKFSGTDSQSVDAPSAYVTVVDKNGQSLGTYLLSTLPLPPPFPGIDQPQTLQIDGKQYWLQLRFKRLYKPYTVHLLKFTHDRYLGTDVAKNFASYIRLVDPARNVDREVKIWMNHPLRYAGETFYQQGFSKGDQTSILEVVHNPGWLIPYISCAMVGLGLLIHFGIHLIKFLGRVRSQKLMLKSAGSVRNPSWIPAGVIAGICVLYLISGLHPPDPRSGTFDLNQFAHVPVLYEGRVMPLDSLARDSLRILSGKADVTTDDGHTRTAVEWLADVFSQPEKAMSYDVFRIDHPEIKTLLGLKDEPKKVPGRSALVSELRNFFGLDGPRKRFSAKEIEANLDKLREQYELATQVEPHHRDLYQRKIVELANHYQLFNQLASIEPLYLSPPMTPDQKNWRTFGDAIDAFEKTKQPDAGAGAVLEMIRARNQDQPDAFNEVASAYMDAVHARLPDQARKLDIEVLFNRAEPFIQCMALYVIVFVLAAMSWLKWHGTLSRAALWVLVVALILHTLGLVTRIYLQGRPPVTNLYSSAIFIAWAAVAFCVGMELIYRNGVACAAAAVIAFPSLLIAHYLALDPAVTPNGDTMQMLQAVLDTNIWLATHVVVITLGYTATFLAGFLAIAYILGGVFTPALGDPDTRKTIARMIYGVLCFAILFSFVGTILGGIWADQSWGRFWGWDPKENGAVLIVLWNAIVLHARWGGIVKERGVALLAVAGNIITSWSWFGTNMLGVGLHSYGFMDSAVSWLAFFVASQVMIIALGSLPLQLWRSYHARPAAVGAD